ncbi:MAG: hypothetical protein ACJ79S_17875 [Gemmatimonadaceae bacterium]
MEQQMGGTATDTGSAAGFSAGFTGSGDGSQGVNQAAERLSAVVADLDRRYGVSATIREHPWPALAIAAGVGYVLAGTSLDQGASSATAQATRGIKSSAGSLVETLAAAATATVTQALHGQLDGLVSELKQAIGAPPPGRRV